MLAAVFAQAQPAGYVEAPVCGTCHAKIAASYARTGMGRSFGNADLKAASAPEIADFYHAASDSHYSMLRRGGAYVQRRWQTGFDGREVNVEEREAAFVLGSGNHAKTWLARGAAGKLIELPLGWYAENGGSWGMNPGYDAAHPPAQRAVPYECMFCHNGYPRVAAGHGGVGSEPAFAGALPQGIDCQRCHGPGEEHVRAARRPGANAQAIRGAIVNPARLSGERGMEVCLQCHLETASTRVPSLVRRFGREPFSYVAGQPLADFTISFDHAPGTGHEDKFEVAGAAYRLRQSRCFLESRGQLTCTTCHNPHDIPRGEEAVKHYAATCRGCHKLSDALHVSATGCTGCHMPKRRTEDAIHVAMTDHRIVRRPPAGDPMRTLAERHPAASEEYRGEVVPYYPAPLGTDHESQLYLAAAQTMQGNNLDAGIERLSKLLAEKPAPAFLTVLGDALRQRGDFSLAAAQYEKAGPDALRQQGAAWRDAGELTRSRDALTRAATKDPEDARIWLELGLTLSKQNRRSEAIEALNRSAALDPDVAAAWNGLGANKREAGEEDFRHALSLDPWHAAANANLAGLLASRGAAEEAVYYFAKAAALGFADASIRYEYALSLVQLNRFEESQAQVEKSIAADAGSAEAHELLGGLLSRRGDTEAALVEYREAVRLKPEFGRAQLDLAATLAGRGDIEGAVPHLREAAKSPDARVAQPARRALEQLGRLP